MKREDGTLARVVQGPRCRFAGTGHAIHFKAHTEIKNSPRLGALKVRPLDVGCFLQEFAYGLRTCLLYTSDAADE